MMKKLYQKTCKIKITRESSESFEFSILLGLKYAELPQTKSFISNNKNTAYTEFVDTLACIDKQFSKTNIPPVDTYGLQVGPYRIYKEDVTAFQITVSAEEIEHISMEDVAKKLDYKEFVAMFKELLETTPT